MPSMPPPGVNGTTSLTKRVGQVCREGPWALAVRLPIAGANTQAADVWMS